MTAVDLRHAGVRDGKEVVKAFIVADSVPSTLPVTGECVTGMTADQVFAPFSIIYVTASDAATKLFVANETGTFVAQ